MQRILFYIILTFFCLPIYSQSYFRSIDQEMSKIPHSETYSTVKIAKFIGSRFKSDSARVRAVFIFITDKIDYDLDMYKLVKQKIYPEISAQNTLNKRKGVCEEYASLFQEICNKLNLTNIKVNGLAQAINPSQIDGHAWNIVKINGNWMQFDPTWGAGFVSNGKYFKRFDSSFFMANPLDFRKTHYPNDYIFQLTNIPITYNDFINKKFDKSFKINHDYIKEINKYLSQSISDQKESTILRMEENKIENEDVKNDLSHQKTNKAIDHYNLIVDNMKQCVTALNRIIDLKNNQFKSVKSDQELTQIIQLAKSKINIAKSELMNINAKDLTHLKDFELFKKSIIKLDQDIDTQDNFIKEYLSKNTIDRKSMFYKVIIQKSTK